MSATRPAKTEMLLGAPPASAPATSSTWRTVISAVTLTWTPSPERSLMNAVIGSARVLVTGIFTYTLGPQEAISWAWRRMPSASSEKTSNEIGRSVICASTSRAKAA